MGKSKKLNQDHAKKTQRPMVEDDPPIVAYPITDITVEKDAENQTIDLSAVFSDNIQLEVANNSNADLVTLLLNGNDLTLDFLDNQKKYNNSIFK